MPHLLVQVTVTAAATLAALLPGLAGGRSEAADPPPKPAPECVHHYSDWRYTTVVNDCDTTVSVTVEYANGRPAPCRTLAPGDAATFAGYGFDQNHVVGLRTCVPGTT
ncbi:alpha-amylase [Streptomyces sp. NPDC014995]|uniref:alpha-amylase n=1 Tax=Streptomyces sp. NPDC014995 TaxID=3364936 RepID=UPI0036FA6448